MGGSLAATIALQPLVIISGVLVARALGPEDRGYLALLVVVSGVCSILGSLGLPAAVTFYVARDNAHARAIASSIARVGMVQVGIMLAVQAAILVALVADDPDRVKVAAAISLVLVPGILALLYGLAILQGQHRFTAFNILRILPTTAYVAGVVAIFLLDEASLVTIMTVWATANLGGGLLALCVAVRGLPRASPYGSPPRRSRMTWFGLKSLLGSMSPVDSLRLDQAVVGLFLNPVALGLYVVAQAFTNLPRAGAATVGLVAYPKVAAESDPADSRRAMWKYFFFALAVTALVVGVLEVAAGSLVTLFFGSEFTGSVQLLQILLVGSLFVGARRVLTDGLNGLGHPGLGTIAEVASWFMLVPALALLLPRFGAEGVAFALGISWGGSLVLLIALAVVLTRDSPTVFRSRFKLRLGTRS